MYAVPQLHHALDTLCGGGVQLLLCHDGIFPEIHIPVHNGIGEVFYIRVGGDGDALLGRFLQFGRVGLPVLAANVFDGIVQLVGQHQPLNRLHCEILFAVLCTFGALTA